MPDGTQTIDYSALAKQAGAISSQPAGDVDYAALAKQAGAMSSAPPMPSGSYQARKGGPILNANDSALHTGIVGLENSLGITQPPTGIWDALTQAGGNLRKFAGQSWDELKQATGEQNATPGLGTPFTDALILPHMAAKGIEGLASGIENSASDIEAGVKRNNPSSAAFGIGNILGMRGQLEAGERGGKAIGDVTSNIRAKASAPLADTVTKPRGSTPAESYTPEQLKAYADQNGIDINAAQATNHNLPRNLQSAGERSTVGGTAVKQQIAKAQAQVSSHAESLANTFSPNTPDLATAGDAIKSGVQTALEREQATAQQSYQAIDQQANGVTVDLRPVKTVAAQVLTDSNFLRDAGLDPKTATRILQGISNVSDDATFSQAQQMRSALLDATRTPELAISNTAQGMLKQVIGATDSAMMDAARSRPGLEPSFRAANNHWLQLQEDFNNPRSPLAQILQEPDPSKVPQKLTQRGQIAGSPYNAQLLDRYGIDKGPVKWAILNDLMDKNFGLRGPHLGGYSDDFLRSVFNPTEMDQVYKTGAIARSVGLNTNPSGTAAVSGAMADVQKPIRSLAPKAGAAKLTNSPGFNQWMMRTGAGAGTTPPLSSLLGAGAGVMQTNRDIFDDETLAQWKKDHAKL
jgi:hypothetical protein